MRPRGKTIQAFALEKFPEIIVRGDFHTKTVWVKLKRSPTAKKRSLPR